MLDHIPYKQLNVQPNYLLIPVLYEPIYASELTIMSDFEQRQPSDNLPARGELIDPETRVGTLTLADNVN